MTPEEIQHWVEKIDELPKDVQSLIVNGAVMDAEKIILKMAQGLATSDRVPDEMVKPLMDAVFKGDILDEEHYNLVFDNLCAISMAMRVKEHLEAQ